MITATLKQLFLGSIALLLLASCTSDTDDVETCSERKPTQTEGVYGCITQTNDIGEPTTSTLSGFSVEIFRSAISPTTDDTLTPFMKATSDEIGFFEIGLAPGTYWICTSFRRCAELAIPANTTVVMNYDFGPGPGW